MWIDVRTEAERPLRSRRHGSTRPAASDPLDLGDEVHDGAVVHATSVASSSAFRSTRRIEVGIAVEL